MQKKVGVLGIGEVGSAIVKILSNKFEVLRKDVNFDEINNHSIEGLHICLPFSDQFSELVLNQIKKSKPKLTIIHSTIKVGTTKSIAEKVNSSVVHSPVMGTHPNLDIDMKNFIKLIGPTSDISGKLAATHLKKAGFKVHILNSSDETELGKLLDTTYFGWNIIFCKLVGKLCEETGLNFENVYTQFNQIYNQGYKKSKPNVIRPVLKYKYPKDIDGGIGGHCVIPNAQVLNDQFKFEISDFIINTNEKLKKGSNSPKK